MLEYYLIKEMRSGQLLLPDFLSQVEARFLEREPNILALLPEENRFTRLHDDADTLVTACPRLISSVNLGEYRS